MHRGWLTLPSIGDFSADPAVGAAGRIAMRTRYSSTSTASAWVRGRTKLSSCERTSYVAALHRKNSQFFSQRAPDMTSLRHGHNCCSTPPAFALLFARSDLHDQKRAFCWLSFLWCQQLPRTTWMPSFFNFSGAPKSYYFIGLFTVFSLPTCYS